MVNNTGGGGGTKSTMGIRSQVRRSGEDWFEPVLNIHTPLSPLSPQIFLFAPLELGSLKNVFRKIIGGGGICLPYRPPKFWPMFGTILHLIYRN
jgi:hypothetical protein